MIILFICRHVLDLIRDLAIDHTAVRSLDEAVFIDSCIRSQIGNQTNVRAFRSLDRADSSIVAVMNITDLEACPLTRQSARTKCRNTALVGQLRQRVLSIHELRQLRRREELLDRCRQRTDIRQLLRGKTRRICNRHTLLDGTLHTGQTDAELILDQLADRTDTAVSEHIDIIYRTDPIQHRQLIVVQRIHIRHRDGMLRVQRINADELDRIAIIIQDPDLLHACTDQPYRNRISSHDSAHDSFLIRRRQLRLIFIRNISSGNQRVIFMNQILAIDRQSSDCIHTRTIVQNRADIVIGNLHFICEDSCINGNLAEFLGKCLGIFRRDDRSLIIMALLAIQIRCQNSSDQSLGPGSIHDCCHRMREQMVERQRNAGNTLVDLRSQLISFLLADDLVLLDENLAVCTDEIISQTMILHAVQDVQLLQNLIASCLGQIIPAVIEELLIHRGESTIDGRNFICSLVLINTEQRIMRGLCLICSQRVADLFVVSEDAGIQQHIIIEELTLFFRNDDIRINIKVQCLQELLHASRIKGILTLFQIQGHADCLEQNRGENLSSPVNRHIHDPAQCGLLIIRHEFQPRAAARNQFTGISISAGALF